MAVKGTPRGADHHKDDISLDFDRVCCQILDDSIARGETETIHFPHGRPSLFIMAVNEERSVKQKRKEKLKERAS